MNILDKFRYSKDNPSQLSIVLKDNPYQKRLESNKENLANYCQLRLRYQKKYFQTSLQR